MTTFTKVIRAGGCEAAVTKDFDVDRALHREKLWACAQIIRELEACGRLTVGPKVHSGDYVQQVVTLHLGELPDAHV